MISIQIIPFIPLVSSSFYCVLLSVILRESGIAYIDSFSQINMHVWGGGHLGVIRNYSDLFYDFLFVLPTLNFPLF